jgi:hypothetical protein
MGQTQRKERREEEIMAYSFPKDLDPAQFKNNLDALWIFAHALKDSATRGKLQHMEGAEFFGSLCGAFLDEIEEAIDREKEGTAN